MVRKEWWKHNVNVAEHVKGYCMVSGVFESELTPLQSRLSDCGTVWSSSGQTIFRRSIKESWTLWAVTSTS
jgi:hypothetical protein